MNSYNKATLNRIAKEQGFIRDNIEKVMRMVEILRYFSESALQSLPNFAPSNHFPWLGGATFFMPLDCSRQGKTRTAQKKRQIKIEKKDD